ncbi:MAG: hypothetical protein RL189_3320 [Pseudomonadota bacterium]|jgi:hypothetical membrane protein
MNRSLGTAILLAVLPCSWLPLAAHGEVTPDDSWTKILEEERTRLSSNRFWETGISGLAVLSIGVYGSNYDSREFVTSSIYALMQSGGVILMSQSLRDYLGASSILTTDEFFKYKRQISRQELQQIILQSKSKNERANVSADLFLWTGLSLIYLQAAFKEAKSESTARSLYFFLSANSGILAGASAFKLFWGNGGSQKPSHSTLRLSATGQSLALQWKKDF